MARNILRYLMSQLSIKALDWNKLDDKDKADLRRWADEEMAVLGIDE